MVRREGVQQNAMLRGEGTYRVLHSGSHTKGVAAVHGAALWKSLRKKRCEKITGLSQKVMYLSFDALNGINYNSNSPLRECLKTL